MKKRFTKSLVAMVALVAMLTQNAYGVYAAASSPLPIQVDNEFTQEEEAAPEIEVVTEESNSDEGNIEEGYEESSEEATPVEYADGDLDVAEEEPTDDVNYDDEIMLINEEESEAIEESVDEYSEENLEEAEEIVEEELAEEIEEDEEVPEELEILDTQISGSGLDEVSVYIDTNALNEGDSFRIIFTGPDSANYDTRLNDDLDTTSQGTYTFTDLNKEGFNIRATSDDNVRFEFTSDGGTPVIKAISIDVDADSMLYIKSISANDGKPLSAVFGEGYSNITLKLDTENLDPKAEYTLYVDTDADVEIDGSYESSVTLTKSTETITLSNLDKKQFTAYVTGIDGDEKFIISSDATIVDEEEGRATFFVSSEEIRTKREYTYSDADVTVTATLQFAEAVPDDAEFRVTPITSQNAVDAYLGALNNNSDEESEYTEENTLLYDIAFLVDKVDEDGNVIEGEKVEFEPEEGSVTIDIKFNKSQLTDEIGATESQEIEVVHLPLTEDVKESVDTTVDADNISASDVIVEAVEASVEVEEGGADTVSFVTDSFSAYALINVNGNNAKYESGTSRDYKDIMGRGTGITNPSPINYAIVANKIEEGGHFDGNYATKWFAAGGDNTTAGQYTGNHNPGGYIIGKFSGTNAYHMYNGNGGKTNNKAEESDKKSYVYVPNDDTNPQNGKLDIEDQGANLELWRKKNNIIKTDYTKSDLDGKVDSMISGIQSIADLMAGEENAYTKNSKIEYEDRPDGKGGHQFDNDWTKAEKIKNGTIDLSMSEGGTYYFTYPEGVYNETAPFNQKDGIKVKYREDQTVVFTIPDSKIDNLFGVYMTEVDKNGNEIRKADCGVSDSSAAPFTKHFVFNCPNATSINLQQCVGMILAPKATVEAKSVATGWIVCNIFKNGAEFHGVWDEMPPTEEPNDASFQIGVEKEIQKATAADNSEKFEFRLYTETNNSFKRDDFINNPEKYKVLYLAGGEKAYFPTITYNKPGIYHYVIEEVYNTDTHQDSNWSPKLGLFAHIIVNVDSSYNVTAKYLYNIDNACRYRNDGTFCNNHEEQATALNTGDYIKFINTKHSSNDEFEIKVNKSFDTTGATTKELATVNSTLNTKPFKFILTPLTGYQGKENVKTAPTDGMQVATDGSFIQTIVGAGTVNFNARKTKLVYNDTDYNSTYTRDDIWASNEEGRIADNATVYSRIYMYSLVEEHPANATLVTKNNKQYYFDSTTGIYYDASVYYIKVFHDSCKSSDGNLKWVESHMRAAKAIVTAGANGTVTISDSNNSNPCESIEGEFSFDNLFEAPKGSLAVTKAVKTENNVDFSTTDTFYFKVLDENENQVGEVHSITKNETVTINNLEAGTYTVVETDENGTAVESNSTNFPYVVSYSSDNVEVVKNETAAVTITNTKSVQPTSIQIGGAKTVSNVNYTYGEGDFEFNIVGACTTSTSVSAPMPSSNKAQSHANHTFGFGEIEFTKNHVNNTFTYTITETAKTGFAENNETYVVTVVVTQDGNRVVATPSVTKTGTGAYTVTSGKAWEHLSFTNSVTANGSVEFEVTKTLTGRNFKSKEFTFTLKSADAASDAKMPTGATEGADGRKVITKTTTVTSTGYEAINFGTVNFDQTDAVGPGKTYNYVIDEVGTDKDGVTYDVATYNVSVAVTYVNNIFAVTPTVTKVGGTATPEGTTYVSGNKVSVPFNNAYTASGRIPFKFTKSISNFTAPDGFEGFTFELYEVDSADATPAAGAEPLASKTLNTETGAGDVVFNAIEYTAPGIHHYYVKEVVPSDAVNNKKNGITYTATPVRFSVEVFDKGDGSLGVKKDGDEFNPANTVLGTFENDYDVEPVPYTITASKTLTGRNMTIGEFSFTMENESAVDDKGDTITAPVPVNATVSAPASNAGVAADFSFTFSGDNRFTKAGTYVYTIKENTVSAANVTPYPYYYKVTINVHDNKRGALTITPENDVVIRKYKLDDTEVEGTFTKPEFTNTYTAEGTVQLQALKTVSGKTTETGAFVFGLYTAANKDSKLYKKDATGALTTTPYTATVNGGGDVIFDAITYKLEDETSWPHTYTYYIHELGAEDGQTELDGYTSYDPNYYKVEVVMNDNGSGEIIPSSITYYDKDGNSLGTDTNSVPNVPTIINTYNAHGSNKFYARKSVYGFGENDSAETYTFNLKAMTAGDPNLNGLAVGSVIDTQTITGAGDFEFAVLNYELSDLGEATSKVFTYEIQEVQGTNANEIYDTAVRTVTMTVSDLGNGTLNVDPSAGTTTNRISFRNGIPTEDGIDLLAYKSLSGRDYIEDSHILGDATGEFSFTLTEIGEGKTYTETVNNTGDNIEFSHITFTKNDAGSVGAKQRHVYEIAENVPDNTKNVTYNVKGSTYYAVVDVYIENDAIKHDPVVYHLGSATGTIVENIEDVKFENEYADSVTAQFSAKKYLYSDDAKTNKINDFTGHRYEFNFKDETTGNITTVANVNADGTFGEDVTFPLLTFDQESLDADHKIADNLYMYRYTIEEVGRGATVNGTSMDEAIYDAAVYLSVNRRTGELEATKSVSLRTENDSTTDGIVNKLKALFTGNENLIEFKNVYKAEGQLDLSVTKTFSGKEWPDGATFTFELEKEGNLIDTITGAVTEIFNKVFRAGSTDANTATATKDNRTASFETINYTLADAGKTYKYKVTEQEGSLGGVHYDKSYYTVDVSITEAFETVQIDENTSVLLKNGKLNVEATVTYIDEANNSSPVETVASTLVGEDGSQIMVCAPSALGFTNTYSAKDTSAIISGTKNISGRQSLSTDNFEFELAPVGDAPLRTMDGVTHTTLASTYTPTINTTTGVFTFAELKYIADDLGGATSKTFEYTVTEKEGDIDGISYATEDVKTVTVTLTDNLDGTMSADVSPNTVGLVITNTYNSEDSTTLSVTKTVIGTADETQEFKFILNSLTADDPNRGETKGNKVEIANVTAKASETKTFGDAITDEDGTVRYETLKYSLQDVLAHDGEVTYSYEVVEDQTYIAGYKLSELVYTVDVTVTANEDGTLNIVKNITPNDATVTISNVNDPLVFENTYYADGSTKVKLTKSLKGRNLIADEFTFNLYDEEEAVKDERKPLDTVSNAAKTIGTLNTAVDDTMVFDGEYFEYDVEDLKVNGLYTDKNILYYVIEEDCSADSEDSPITYDYGKNVVAVVISNEANNGHLKVTPIVRRFEGSAASAIGQMKQFMSSYEVKENEPEAVVTFENEYDAENEWDPTGKKILNGLPLEKDGLFTFTLNEYEVKDGVATNKIINTATGTNGGENHNQIKFDKEDADFLHYKLSDGDLGLHVYKITEVCPVKKANAEGKYVYNGITYDRAEFTFNVTVSDIDYNGILTVECPQAPDTGDVSFEFTNTYEADTFIDLAGTKVLEGRDLTGDDKFDFSITDITEGSKTNGVTYSVQNTMNDVVFSHESIPFLNYSVNKESRADVGDHKYEIRETSTSSDGITCDTEVYTVTVKVADDGQGGLTAKITRVTTPLTNGVKDYDYTQTNSFTFTNKYNASADMVFKGVKHLKRAAGAEDVVSAAELAGKYNFSVYEYTNNERTGTRKLVSSTACDGEGKYTLFGPSYTQSVLRDGQKYKESAEFYYQIVETKPSEGTWDGGTFTGVNGVVYDNTVYNVNVTVKPADAKSDKLKLEVRDADTGNYIPTSTDAKNTYTVEGTAGEIKYFDFTNIKPQDTSIRGTKSWSDGVTDASSRPDVLIDLYSSEDNFTSVIKTATIVAPADSYEFTKLPAVDKFGKAITYRVSERPLDGYVSVQDGFNFINIKATVAIRKVDALTGDALTGAELTILNSAGAEVDRWTSGTEAHSLDMSKFTTGATYTLHEVSAPDGYQLAADKTFEIPRTGTMLVTMEDPRVVGSVRLRKLDAESRETLAGAEFALYTEAGDRVYASGSAGSYEFSRTSSNGRFAVNGAGELEITGLPYGSYYFTEIAAPAGYRLSSERATFSVLTDGSVAEVTFLNTKERGSARLMKTNADGSRPLAGAVFELYARTPSSITAAIASTIYSDAYYRVGTYTTDASGMIYVDDLPWDDYYFVEVEAPTGYEVNRDVNGDLIAYRFTLGTSGSASVSYDLGRITNSVTPDTPPTTPPTTPPSTPPSTPRRGGEVRGARTPRVESSRRPGGVLSGVLGVRAAPKQGVLGERLGPVTGDAFNILLWMLLLLASIGAILGVAVANVRRKRRAAR